MQQSTKVLNNFNLKTSNYDTRTQQKLLNMLKTEVYPVPFSILQTKLFDYSTNRFTMTPKIIDNEAEEQQQQQQDEANVTANNAKISKARKKRSRNSLRYMTQPITLLEIRETDEDLNEATTTATPANEPVKLDCQTTDDILSKNVYGLYLNDNFMNRRANKKSILKKSNDVAKDV